MSKYNKHRKYTYLDAFINSSIVEKLSVIICVPMIIFIIRMIFSYYE